jgi:hypothetical protein
MVVAVAYAAGGLLHVIDNESINAGTLATYVAFI